MSTSASNTDEELLVAAVRSAISEKIALMAEEEMELAKNRIEKRIGEVISAVSIAVAQQISYARLGSDLIITVRGHLERDVNK